MYKHLKINNMKALVIVVMIVQLLLITLGVYDLFNGKIEFGLFLILFNGAFFGLNIVTLGRLINNH